MAELEVDLKEKPLSYKDEKGKEIKVDVPGSEEEYQTPLERDFYENLAESLDKQVMGKLASDLIKAYEDDKSSRKNWEDQYSKGLKMLGVIVEDRNDPFPGASGVHHPLLAEAATQFQARAISELFPAQGPVKTQILGKVTDKKTNQAQRVQDYMNYQVTTQIPDYFNELDQMLFYLSLAGSAFKKVYFDNTLDRICTTFVPAEELVISNDNTDLISAERYTQVMRQSINEIKKYMVSGYYRQVPITKEQGYSLNTQDSVQKTLQRLEGMSPSMADQLHTVLEIHADYDLGEDKSDLALPYIVTIDYDTRQVLSVRRNWQEFDPLMKKINYFVHYKYLPGLGFYGFGLIHMIGGLQHASTGALRALLDSAAFSNLQGGFRAKGARIEGGDISVSPGEWVEVEAYGDDLRKSFVPLPFKEPSQTLLQLLGLMSEAGRRFASIADAMVGDSAASGPVGTTIALIEQGSKVFSAIHKRVHQAQGREFQLIYRLNGEYLDAEYPYDVIGEKKLIRRKDFDASINVVPVSDPNIFSQAQRIALAQTGLQLAQSAPQLINVKEAYRRFLQALNVPDYENLLLEDELTPRRDPVSENMAVLNGDAIKVFEDQDQAAHIAVHEQFMADPRYAGSKAAREMLYPPMLAHLGQHMAYLYQQQMQSASPQTPTSSGEFNKELEGETPKELPIKEENAIATAAAQAARQLAGSMPVPVEQQKQDVEAQAKMEGLALKKKDLQIREQRFKSGEKRDEQVQRRLDAEAKSKIVETASRVARSDKKK